MNSLPEIVAAEVMDMIERERRINKDDLILAAEIAIGKHRRAAEAANPAYVFDTGYYYVTKGDTSNAAIAAEKAQTTQATPLPVYYETLCRVMAGETPALGSCGDFLPKKPGDP